MLAVDSSSVVIPVYLPGSLHLSVLLPSADGSAQDTPVPIRTVSDDPELRERFRVMQNRLRGCQLQKIFELFDRLPCYAVRASIRKRIPAKVTIKLELEEMEKTSERHDEFGQVEVSGSPGVSEDLTSVRDPPAKIPRCVSNKCFDGAERYFMVGFRRL